MNVIDLLLGMELRLMLLCVANPMYKYRVFDNDWYKVWAYCPDQKASLELKTGGKLSLSLVHFDKYMSNWDKKALLLWMALSEILFKFRKAQHFISCVILIVLSNKENLWQ
jgi:hypothetical protein